MIGTSEPTVLSNLRWFWESAPEPADRLALLVAFSGAVRLWLDKTRAKGHPAVAELLGMYERVAAFDHLEGPLGGLGETVAVYKRLRGLVRQTAEEEARSPRTAPKRPPVL